MIKWNKELKKFLYGNEGDACSCGHLYCYHLDDDEIDSTIAGCQKCNCLNVWKEQ